MVSAAGEEIEVAAPPTGSTFLDRIRDRPRPSFAVAVSAGGGIIVWLGVLLIAADVYSDGEDGWVGASFFVALTALGTIAIAFAPRLAQPGSVTAIVLSIPTIYAFLIFPDADSFGDARVFFVLTIVTWVLFFAFANSRGRPILLGLAAALLYVWILGEVANTDEITQPSPEEVPFAAPLDRGLADRAPGAGSIERAGFATQETTLDDLDSSDPLYPLAEACADGSFDVCDELWDESEPGSDFEAFAEACGGDPIQRYPCTESFGEDFGDDFGTNPDGQLDDPFDVTPFGEQEDKALEIGLISLLFGSVYLAAMWLLDRRRMTALGTAFVPTAVIALVIAVTALGEKTDSAIAGGLFGIVTGIAIGVVGWLASNRRFTTWIGGTIASVGALVIAADVAPEPSPSEDDPDLIGAGLVVLAFGLAVIGLAWLAHRLMEARAETDGDAVPVEPPETPEPQPSLAGPDAWSRPAPPDPPPAPPDSP